MPQPNEATRLRWGRAVAARRDEMRMSQFKLAIAADLHPQTISKFERGIESVSKDTRERIAAALDTTVDELFATEEAVA
jgi:transcriptional regulator with XRE-family HTH domain